MDDILRIEDLRVYYHERERTVKAVDGVDLALRRGQTLSLLRSAAGVWGLGVRRQAGKAQNV